MSEFNVKTPNTNSFGLVKPENAKEGGVGCVDTLYTSVFLEKDRTTITESFTPMSFEDATQGAKFCNALVDNQDGLMESLNIDEDAYNYLSSVALAIASQETGMGFEEGYNEENSWLLGWGRQHVMMVCGWFGSKSASSGLTQMKIHDFLYNKDTLTNEEKQILSDYGIKSNSAGHNNLYDCPDKAAIATIVVLNAIQRQIGDYHDKLDIYHEEISLKLNDGLTDEERCNKGEEVLNSILNVYQTTETDEEKEAIRTGIKDVLLALSKDDPNYDGDPQFDEEVQLQKFSELTGLEIDEKSLNYLRCFLTSKEQAMNDTEASAYIWNKGFDDNSMKQDRLIAYKIMTFMTSPDDLDYDQFPVNVAKFAQMYYTDMYDG